MEMTPTEIEKGSMKWQLLFFGVATAQCYHDDGGETARGSAAIGAAAQLNSNLKELVY
jgi:hypothetical protein